MNIQITESSSFDLLMEKDEDVFNHWSKKHNNELFFNPGLPKNLIDGLVAWRDYAINFNKNNSYPIYYDTNAYAAWQTWGNALEDLSHEDIGELDIRILQGFIHNTFREVQP